MSAAATNLWSRFAGLPLPVRIAAWTLGFWLLPAIWLASRGSRATTALAVAFLLLITTPVAIGIASPTPDPAPQAVADPTETEPTEPAVLLPVPVRTIPPDTVRPEPLDVERFTTSPQPTPTPDLLHVQRFIDADSFVATDGTEYRVSLVNGPEHDECGYTDTNTAGQALLNRGFTATDTGGRTHGRTVAIISLPDGTSYGQAMTAAGWFNDRYLDDFRHEAPDEAAALDTAIAQARTDQAGHWAPRGCWANLTDPHPDPAPDPPPVPASDAATNSGPDTRCHPAYTPCLPLPEDLPSSYNGDLDCGHIRHVVHLTGNDDPYRLDGNNTHRENGIGCESYA